MHPDSKINKLLEKISSVALPRDLKLDRMQALLDAMGNPEKRIPPVIHVAGTNGKGSVCANLSTIYANAGLRVHRYTSPHLVTYNERIFLAGEMISDKLLRECLAEVVPHTENIPITFFEATTAAAFLAFSKVEADICLLEVGLGGRLDATNVIEKPLLTIITPIGYDHQEYLGDDIRTIAAEKAGIIKAGVPCVVAQQMDDAYAVIKERAEELEAPLYDSGGYWSVDGNTYQSERKVIVFGSSLEGEHQLHNAGVTLASVEVLNAVKDWDISAKEASKALGEVEWPGRLQQLEVSKAKGSIWLDGGHNLLGARALVRWLGEQEAPRTLAIGMLENRDIEGFMRLLAPLCDEIIAVRHFTEAATYEPEIVEAIASSLGKKFEIVKDAGQLIKHVEPNKGTTLITGSLYLVGAVLAEL